MRRRLLLSALAFVLLVGGCTATARLTGLQPMANLPSPPLSLPVPLAVAGPEFQRGIDVDVYVAPGQDFTATAAAVVRYIKALHANAISISFPYFMISPGSSTVYATSRTPSTADLTLLIQDAEHAGLYVSLRPLLDQGGIGSSRATWKPANPTAWFASYQRFLIPYAQMAQAEKVREIFVGAEFTEFQRSPLWTQLDRAIARVFHGRLAYANNGVRRLAMSDGGALAVKTVDAYHPQRPPLLAGWERFDRQLPRGVALSEVGIAAVAHAWRKPWVGHWPVTHVDRSVQARWFTAACVAAAAEHLRGIYFWALPFSTQLRGPAPDRQAAWANSAGAAAIARCFAALARTPR